MPFVKLYMGKFVTTFPRDDGTHRVLFKIPPRLRPSGWSPTIPLPVSAPRTGNLDDLAELARIRADAARLYREYTAARLGREAQPRDDHSLSVLADTWRSSQAWKDNRPRTNKGYDASIRLILRWAERIGDPEAEKITVPHVEEFLAALDDKPTQRYHLRKALRIMMQQAVRLRWRTDNPVDDVKVVMPKTRVAIWEQADVDAYVAAALQIGQPDVAAIILMEWEIGQRLTDVIRFRHGAEYRAVEGCFRFDQSKTGSAVAIPVSDALRASIAACKREGSLYLFHDAKTKAPWPDVERLGHIFSDARAVAVKAGARPLVLRALRHSCVVQLVRAGCDVSEIISITGHSLSSAHSILQIYLPRDSIVARNAQVKRGMIGKESA